MIGEAQHPQMDPVGERTSLLRPAETGYDEENVLHRTRDVSPSSTVGSHHDRDSSQWKKNIVLLLGVFLVNSDSAILLAMFRQIASDFDRLSSASWIVTAYILGLISAQPLYGKLSDIYGRKPLLIGAYSCYCIGGLLAGAGFSFWGVLLGRFICGIGNAGITVLISTLIVDLVPMREVAVWRGYVYAINQVGRGVGPSLGAFIAAGANWRWALLYQVPFNLAGLVFIWWKMSFPQSPCAEVIKDPDQDCRNSKLKRIDFSGSITLALSNVSLLFFLDKLRTGPGNVAQDFLAMIPMSTWLGFLAIFLVVEGFWAKEPIIPLRLLVKRNVMSSYAIQFLQTGAQMALYTSVPLYFRVTMGDSDTKAAIRLLFITLGTVAGGLISGFVIKRTGLYRLVTIVSVILSNISFLAIFVRWRGATGWGETLYGFPIGLGFGVSLSAAYIGLTARLESFQVAVGTSGFYLSLNLGSLFGVSAASMLISTFVERTLRKSLSDLPDVESIIHDVTSNFDRINQLPEKVAQVVLSTYTKSFINVWLFSLVFGCLALMASFIMREGELDNSESNSNQKRPARLPRQDYNTFRDTERRDA